MSDEQRNNKPTGSSKKVNVLSCHCCSEFAMQKSLDKYYYNNLTYLKVKKMKRSLKELCAKKQRLKKMKWNY